MAPSPITLTAPAPGFSVSTAGLALTWTGASAGDVDVTMTYGEQDLLGVGGIDCRFPAAAGSAFVPPEAIAQLTGGIETFSVTTIHAQPIAAGGWTLEVGATFDAVFADGSLAYAFGVPVRSP